MDKMSDLEKKSTVTVSKKTLKLLNRIKSYRSYKDGKTRDFDEYLFYLAIKEFDIIREERNENRWELP